jgi:hypothetical protein
MSFRRYGGIDRAATNNIIRNHVDVSDILLVTNQVGEPNSRIEVDSELDTGFTGSQGTLGVTGPQGLTGPTGPMGKNVTGGTGSFNYLAVNNLTGGTGSFNYLTGGTGSFNYLAANNLTGNNASFQTIQSTSFTTITSDYRIKENVIPLNETHTTVSLNPVSYLNTKVNKNEFGLIAHEVQEKYPELVTGEKDGINLQSLNYMGLIPILINENKIFKKRMDELEDEIVELKQLILHLDK